MTWTLTKKEDSASQQTEDTEESTIYDILLTTCCCWDPRSQLNLIEEEKKERQEQRQQKQREREEDHESVELSLVDDDPPVKIVTYFGCMGIDEPKVRKRAQSTEFRTGEWEYDGCTSPPDFGQVLLPTTEDILTINRGKTVNPPDYEQIGSQGDNKEATSQPAKPGRDHVESETQGGTCTKRDRKQAESQSSKTPTEDEGVQKENPVDSRKQNTVDLSVMQNKGAERNPTLCLHQTSGNKEEDGIDSPAEGADCSRLSSCWKVEEREHALVAPMGATGQGVNHSDNHAGTTSVESKEDKERSTSMNSEEGKEKSSEIVWWFIGGLYLVIIIVELDVGFPVLVPKKMLDDFLQKEHIISFDGLMDLYISPNKSLTHIVGEMQEIGMFPERAVRMRRGLAALGVSNRGVIACAVLYILLRHIGRVRGTRRILPKKVVGLAKFPDQKRVASA